MVGGIEATQGIKPAGLWSRFWANVIDGMIVGTPILILLSLVYLFIPSLIVNIETKKLVDYLGTQTSTKTVPNTIGNIISLILFTTIIFCYSIYLNVRYGATWGKDAYGLRVIKYGTTNYINYKTAFIRELSKSLPGITYIKLGGIINLVKGLGDFFLIVAGKQKRTIHDRIAGTQVIKYTSPWPMRKQIKILLPLILVSLTTIAFYYWSYNIWLNRNWKVKAGTTYSAEIFNSMNRQITMANNTKRRSDVNAILNSVNQYQAENNGKTPSVIPTFSSKIASDGVDLCKIIVPSYLAALPVDPTLATTQGYSSVTDCQKPYSTGYLIFRDSSTNKITVRALYAEGETIEVAR